MAPTPGKKGRNANIIVKIEENWEPDTVVPPIENEDEDDEPSELNVGGSSTHTKDIVAELCKQRAIPSVLELQLQEYFQQHSSIYPLPASESNTVDIDLADSDEETWIIQCPTTIDVTAELMAKKINLEAAHSTIKHCTVPLEAHVRHNSEERVIGLLSGTRVKSFVPAGFVRINQAIPSMPLPVPSSVDNGNSITVPYPEAIRERHPLLGYDFNEHMSLPKRVRKQLSFAQQKAALMYKNVGKTKPASKKKSHTAVEDTAVAAADGQQTVSLNNEPVAESTSNKTKKRKEPPEQEVVVPVTVKQEPQSPKRKRGKKDNEVQTAVVKKEVTMEDDISWLLNI